MINSIHTDNTITPRSLATESLAGEPSPYPSRRFSRVSRRFSTVQPDLEGQSKAEKNSKGRRCAGKLTPTRVAIGVIMVLLLAGFITFLTLYLLTDEYLLKAESQAELVPNRVAVLLRGEAFRQGGRFNRNTISDPKEQMVITDSHFRHLIDRLAIVHGMEVDIFSSTYETDTYNMLKTRLNRNGQLRREVLTAKPGSQDKNVRDVLRLFKQHLESTKADEYKFVVVLRHDMLLKMDLGSALVDAFEPAGSKFMVPFKRAFRSDYHKPFPSMVDTLHAYTPDMHKCFYDMMMDTDWHDGIPEGNGLHSLGENEPFVKCAAAAGVKKLDWILPGVETAASSEGWWNPMYHLAGRPQATGPSQNIDCPSKNSSYVLNFKKGSADPKTKNNPKRYCADPRYPTEL